MREFFYLLFKLCYLRFRIAKIVFENRILSFRRVIFSFYIGYLFSQQRIYGQSLEDVIKNAHNRLLSTESEFPTIRIMVLENR